ncbi:hypothetical protein [Streptococcus sp. CSL10205-OR2]|uniref:hypothetical protein n=1 Tax=Streptococcus sp. CSL10205-OR2 TaxID=2980558 RepID=UPI0021D9617E|nr:hypothetical protein [Streptococcus sp. CSL10205-OR2]MCU9533544.1 hypothetical protein [Streptococcus sp. CSL10205-OR2]
MARRTIDISDIHQKEIALEAEETSYYTQKKKYQEKEENLEHRRFLLHQMVQEEKEKMNQTLKRFSLPPSEAMDFFNKMEHLLSESDSQFKRQYHQLEEERELAKSKFQQLKNQLEIELKTLRKEYANDNE